MCNVWPAILWLSRSVLLAPMIAEIGCVPTVSMHKYRDVELSIRQLIRRLFTTLSSERPKAVEAQTDEQGKVVVRLADYAWDILLFMNEPGVDTRAEFSLAKEMVRHGGVVVSYSNPRFVLELRPITPDESTDVQCDQRAGP